MKIFVAADFLMTKESEQRNNIRWVFDFINLPIKKIANINLEKFESSFFDKSKFNRSLFFKKSGINLDKYEQQFYFQINDISDDSLDYLKTYLGESIVIGYELSEQTRYLLNKTGTRYIDIWLHPARFLDDVYFAFRSNDKNINCALRSLQVDEELFFAHASRLKVQGYKGFKRINDKIKEETAVFVGQTLYDKAICCNGRMLSVLDFKEEFENLTKEHSSVIYSRHPFVKNGDEEILAYVCGFRNVALNKIPTYELLCSESVKKILTVSSSVATEARYFGKIADYLYKPPVPVYGDSEAYITIGQEWLFSGFWSKVLASCVDVLSVPLISFESKKDKFRDALSFYWGYRNIDKLESFKQTFSKFVA